MRLQRKFPIDSGILSKQLALFFVLALSAGVVWADNKPWKGKPYSEWTDKDIQIIMTESPWVRVTTIRRTWLPVSEKDVAPEQQIAGGVREMPQASPNVGGASPEATTRESEASEHQLNVYVYWDSSRVMRAAQARQRVLHGEMKESEMDSYMRQPQEEYVLVLAMGDMTPFIKGDEKFFQANSSLLMRRGKLTLPPSRVAYQKDANRHLKQVVFFFPKKTASGEPTIGSDETDVEFKCKIADTMFHVDFDPRKMTDPSGPDL